MIRYIYVNFDPMRSLSAHCGWQDNSFGSSEQWEDFWSAYLGVELRI
jgi:hypothetical protein